MKKRVSIQDVAQLENLKIVAVGGGTGGHVTPLLALMTALREKHPSWMVFYIGACQDKIGKKIVNRVDFWEDKRFVLAGKWRRFGPFQISQYIFPWKKAFWRNVLNFAGLTLVAIGFVQSLIYLMRLRPDLVFSKGGYVAFGPCLAARILKIPLVIHDSDAVSGLAHRLVRDYATLKLTGLPTVGKQKKDRSLRYVGVPVNPLFQQSLTTTEKRQVWERYGLPGNAQVITVAGGSSGARSINRAIAEVADKIKFKRNTYILLIPGAKLEQEARQAVAQSKVADRILVTGFVHDLPDVIRASQGVVIRAGATMLCEVSLAGKPTIIIPNPILPGSHQMHNARIYQKARAAWLVSDSGSQVNQRALIRALNEMIGDGLLRRKHQRNIIRLARPDAVNQSLQAIEEVILGIAQESIQNQASAIELVEIRRVKSQAKPAIKKGGLMISSVVLGLFIGVLIFKGLYINSVKLVASEKSPLVDDRTLISLEERINNTLQTEVGFWQRHFFLDAEVLQGELLKETYIKDVSFRRDTRSSQLIIDIEPRHIFAKFFAPNLKTILTDDGYAVPGYHHLFSEHQGVILTIETPYEVDLQSRQQLILSSLDLKFLNQINVYLASQGYQLIWAKVSTNPGEISFKLKRHDFEIIASTAEDPLGQGIALVLALQFFANPQENTIVGVQVEDVKDEPIQALEPIIPEEYIDIRLIDRVLYK